MKPLRLLQHSYTADHDCNAGFSLVELSIVLVILGLLVGGILAGQSLVRAAELRSVTADMNKYTTAAHAFRDKYFAFPGDMSNATSFWGAAHATPATCRTTASTTQATCDGDGNRQIGSMDAGTTYSEYFRAWQHLANAGLIEGTYSGVAGAGGITDANAGVNSPVSKIPQASFLFAIVGVIGSGNATWFEGAYGNALEFGSSAAAWDTMAPILKPEEAWNIDTKMDDGKPGTGRIVGVESYTTCSTTTVATTAEYNLPNSSKDCALVFKNAL